MTPAQPVPWRPLAAGLALQAAVLVWASARTEHHRDELYFLAAGRRLAWGYPDQPPLTPFVARLTDVVHAHSTVALKLPAVAVALWVTVLAALLAREFGGGRFAQLLAAFAVGSGTVVLVSGHLLATSTIDLGVWVTMTWLVARLLRTGDQRLWVAVGAVAGVGLVNKQLPAFLGAALLAGMLLTPQARPLTRSRWLVVGAALAALAWTPVLLWQARNGWPQLTLAGQIRDEYGTPVQRLLFAVQQLGLFSLGATVLWVAGVWRVFRDPAAVRFRPFAWAWIVLMVVFAVTAGQVYYAAGSYPALVALGAVAAERWRKRALVVVGTAASALLVSPAALPVLPPATLEASPLGGLGEPLLESVGWTRLVDQVAAAYATIPVDRRERAVVFTSNYGEAGAVEEYGPVRGLPRQSWSGHNGFGWWGPPPDDAGPVVLVWQGDPARWFRDCTSHGRVVTGVGNEEGESASVHVCAGPHGGWATAWPQLRHLSA